MKVNNRQKVKGIILVLFILSLFLINTGNVFAREYLSKGEGRFVFKDEKADPQKLIPVWYYMPSKFSANSPILFVISGYYRDGKKYMEPWKNFAERNGVLLLAPEFPHKYFPGARGFHLGNIYDKDGKRVPEEKWTFTSIEHIFDCIKESTGNRSPRYYIYGHSAGGQFVHRFVIFKPDARVKKAIAANAGWYTVPDFNQVFPYGLYNSPANEEGLKKSFGIELVILLGDKDNDPDHKLLKRTRKANLQGLHRFARGQYFYETAKKEANRLRTNFNWTLEIVRGAGHSNREMQRGAESLIY